MPNVFIFGSTYTHTALVRSFRIFRINAFVTLYHSLPYILNSARFFYRRKDVWKEKKWLLLWTGVSPTLTHSYSFVFETSNSTSSNILLPHIFHLYVLEFYFSFSPCLILYSLCQKWQRMRTLLVNSGGFPLWYAVFLYHCICCVCLLYSYGKYT
jgi:hypothetical protein